MYRTERRSGAGKIKSVLISVGFGSTADSKLRTRTALVGSTTQEELFAKDVGNKSFSATAINNHRTCRGNGCAEKNPKNRIRPTSDVCKYT